MKRKHKIAIMLIIPSLCILAILLIIFARPYSNGLTLRQNRFYAEFFALEANQDLSARRLTEPIEFFATERTEEIVAGFGYFANARIRMGFENYEYFSAQVGLL